MLLPVLQKDPWKDKSFFFEAAVQEYCLFLVLSSPTLQNRTIGFPAIHLPCTFPDKRVQAETPAHKRIHSRTSLHNNTQQHPQAMEHVKPDFRKAF